MYGRIIIASEQLTVCLDLSVWRSAPLLFWCCSAQVLWLGGRSRPCIDPIISYHRAILSHTHHLLRQARRHCYRIPLLPSSHLHPPIPLVPSNLNSAYTCCNPLPLGGCAVLHPDRSILCQTPALPDTSFPPKLFSFQAPAGNPLSSTDFISLLLVPVALSGLHTRSSSASQERYRILQIMNRHQAQSRPLPHQSL